VQIKGDQYPIVSDSPVIKRTRLERLESNLGINNEEMETYQRIDSSLMIDMNVIKPTPKQTAQSDLDDYDHLIHIKK